MLFSPLHSGHLHERPNRLPLPYLERFSEGGMGVVYTALDTHLDRPVALKFLPAHLGTDKEARERFIQEAKSASAIDHTNICTVFDIDETDDDRLIIAFVHIPVNE